MPRMSRVWLRAAVLAGTVGALAGCSDTPTDDFDDPLVASVRMAPDSAAVLAGDTVSLTLAVSDSFGAGAPGRLVLWHSTDARVGRLVWADSSTTADGAAIAALVAEAVGETRVVATVGGRADTCVVRVPPPVARVILSPPADTIWVGDSLPLTSVLLDASDRPIAGLAPTWRYWDIFGHDPMARLHEANTSLDTPPSARPVVTGVNDGVVWVEAAVRGVSDTARIRVWGRNYVTVTSSLPVASGQVGRPLADVSVRVIHGSTWGEAATPLVGESVAWLAASGAGTVSPETTRTDTAGVATTSWTLGPTAGRQLLAVATQGRTGDSVAVFAVADTSAQLSFVRSGELCLLRLADRGLTCLPWDGTGYSWSPAGDRIAFTSSRSGNAELLVMRADGSEQMRLTNTVEQEASPAWSPDGRWIAVSSDSGHIRLVAPDGSRDTTLTPPTGSRDAAPTWSPDGSRVAVVATVPCTLYPGQPEKRIEILGLDGSRTALQATAHCLGSADAAWDVASPVWAPDGSLIAYEEGMMTKSMNWGTFFVTPDGTGRTLTHVGRAPSWSPDGSALASLYRVCTTCCECYGPYDDLVVIARDGAWILRLTPELRGITMPRWRPVPGAQR